MRLPLLVLALLTLVAAPALARQGPTRAERAAAAKVVRHCAAGRSLAHDPTSALVLARRTLPADIAEYSDCEQRIARALRARRHHRSTGSDRVASVLADCRDGHLDRHATTTTLRRAERRLRARDRACRRAITRALKGRRARPR